MNIFQRAIFKITEKKQLYNLKRGGAIIGDKVVISDPFSTFIDYTRPWLLEIGAYTIIASGSKILTHDHSLSTIRRVYGEWIGEGNITSIGENCFIGMNSVILMGTKIGNNVIVGAGSIVHGEIPDNTVIAGNPAKIICSLEQFYQKRKVRTKEEIVICANAYKRRFGKWPQPKDIGGFKFLFCPRSNEALKKYSLNFDCSGDEPKEVEEMFYNTKPEWNGIEKLYEYLDENYLKANDDEQ